MTWHARASMMLATIRFVVCGLLLNCVTANAAGVLGITLVLSDDTPLYQTFAENFSQNLANQTKIHIVNAEQFADTNAESDLIVTVGIKAATLVAPKSSTPMLATLVTLNQYAEVSSQRPINSPLSAVFLNQPIKRQVNLLRASLPDHTRVGFLYSPDSKLPIEELRNILAQQGIRLIAKQVSANATLHEDLSTVLHSSDILLVSPDSNIYNSNTIRNILLQSYRQGVPLVGYSEALVKAGAICAAYSNPEQIAAQASTIATRFINSRQLPSPQYPQFFSIAVNPDVARSLGIPLPSAELLKAKMSKMQEGNP